MVKKLVIVLVLLLVVAIGAVGYVWYRIDHIAKNQIEAGGQHALGVRTTVEGVVVSLLGGTMDVSNVVIANPPGYPGKHLLAFDTFDIALSIVSLFGDTVEVSEINLKKLDMYIEKVDGKMNVTVVSDHMEKASGEKPPGDPADPGRKVKVDRIVIDGIVAHVQAPLTGKTLDVEIKDPIVLENVTQENAQGVAMAEVYERIWPAILAAIIQKGGGLIPADMLNDLKGNLTSLTSKLGGDAAKLASQSIEQLGGNAAELVKGLPGDVGKTIQDATGDLGKTVEEGIGKILPGGDSSGGKKKKGLGDLIPGGGD